MTSNRIHRILAIHLLVLGLVAAACSGGGGDSTASTTTTTTTEPAGDDVGTTAAPTVPDRDDEPDVVQTECPVDALDDADGPVEITMWHSMTATNAEVIDQFVADYNAAQDRVVVDASFQGIYSESFEKYINTLRSGGDRPDVIQANETVLQQMVDSQSIIPVQACIDAEGYDLSDFTGRLMDQYRIGDVVVTMPFQLSNPVLYYDGNDFVAAGLDPDQPPSTFAEWLDVSRTLVASGTVEQGIALDIDPWHFEQWLNMAGVPLVDNDNGRSGRATEVLLQSDAVTTIYRFLATLRAEGLISNTGRGTEQSQIGKYLTIALGDATMTVGSSSTLGEIYAQIGQFPDVDLRVAPLPGPTGGGTAIGGGSLYLTDDTSPEVRAAAWDFMKWLNEPTQQIAWSAATGYIPTRKSAEGDPTLEELWTERPGFRVAFDQLAAAGPIPGGGGPVIGDHLGVREAIVQSLEALHDGVLPEDAQAQAHEDANEALADYNRRIGV